MNSRDQVIRQYVYIRDSIDFMHIIIYVTNCADVMHIYDDNRKLKDFLYSCHMLLQANEESKQLKLLMLADSIIKPACRS